MRVDLPFYTERASLAHRLHPVTKLILLGGLCTVALVLRSPAPLLIWRIRFVRPMKRSDFCWEKLLNRNVLK